VLQPGGIRGGERRAAGNGRPRLQPGIAGRVLRAPLPGLDDRRRFDRDPEKPHRREHLRAQLSATCAMSARAFTRWRASGLHLLISATIALAVLAAMLLVWYPRPLFEAAGGNDLLFILVSVDVAIGPLITLLIFKP